MENIWPPEKVAYVAFNVLKHPGQKKLACRKMTHYRSFLFLNPKIYMRRITSINSHCVFE